jgi:hypothetical protein
VIGAIGLFEWSVQTGRLRSNPWNCIADVRRRRAPAAHPQSLDRQRR